MSFSSEQTKQRILACAQQEFLSCDFSQANLRTIAKKANVTTGALYNHFKNKEMLFEAVVGEFAENFLSLFSLVHDLVPQHIKFEQDKKRESMTTGSFEILEFMYDNIDKAKLVFFHSGGTKFEKFIDKLVEIEEASSLRALEIENFELTPVNRFFVHVMSTSGVNNMLEAVQHNLNKNDAFEYMQKIQRFYYAGTIEILKG